MKFVLNNGIAMPAVGLGTYRHSTALIFEQAISAGYRLFDTATAYKNEYWLGCGIRSSGIRRSDLFVTSKVPNVAQRRRKVYPAVAQMLKRMELKYLDLCLLHWPVPNLFCDSWLELERCFHRGMVKCIGVSNFHQHHLEQLLQVATVVPAVNQIELHPLLAQENLSSRCEQLHIHVQAYSPLARMDPQLIGNETLSKIAKAHNKTVPQIVLRWCYQKGHSMVPKASKAHIGDNLAITDFELTTQDVEDIGNCSPTQVRVGYNPDTCDFRRL